MFQPVIVAIFREVFFAGYIAQVTKTCVSLCCLQYNKFTYIFMHILVLFLITNHLNMIMNHSEFSIGIQTWIWLYKIRLPERILVPMRQKVKELTEKIKMCISFTLQQIFFGMFKSGVFNVFCKRVGTVIVGWLAGRTCRQHSRWCTQPSKLHLYSTHVI